MSISLESRPPLALGNRVEQGLHQCVDGSTTATVFAAVLLSGAALVASPSVTVASCELLRARTFKNVADVAYRSGRRLRHVVGSLRQMIGRWVARSRQRRALREIAESDDRHLLRDIGVTREEAFREADKWFWRR
jgi:uncharacterized protein YjiS (DUF1127 family)